MYKLRQNVADFDSEAFLYFGLLSSIKDAREPVWRRYSAPEYSAACGGSGRADQCGPSWLPVSRVDYLSQEEQTGGWLMGGRVNSRTATTRPCGSRPQTADPRSGASATRRAPTGDADAAPCLLTGDQEVMVLLPDEARRSAGRRARDPNSQIYTFSNLYIDIFINI